MESQRDTNKGFLRVWRLLACASVGWALPLYSQSPDVFNPGPGYYVSPIAIQADGKVIFGGDFMSVGGQGRGRLARVTIDGALETAFNATAGDVVYALAIQPDGKILLGGDFTSLGGEFRLAVGRLNTNGTLDTSFTTTGFEPLGTETRVQALLVQPDGKVILGGRITVNSFPPGGYVSRVNTNGVPDGSFSTGGVSGGPVTALAWQADGRILVGGLFSSIGGYSRKRIARLNANGSVDAGFNPGVSGPASTTQIALAFAVQPDGKIIVGGAFTSAAGEPHTNICRLNADGTPDSAFNTVVGGTTYPVVYSLALQADGKILLGGIFNTLNGASHLRIGRLNPDGSVDASFTASTSLDVYGLAVQANGRTLVTGFFNQLGGQPRNYIGRLNNTDPPTQSLGYDGSTITWLRGGTSPEVWRTTFESSTNGTNWTFLGEGSRITGGWELTPVTLPPAGMLRARGYATGGGFNSSSWFVESAFPQIPPTLITTNSSFAVRSNQFGFSIKGSAGSVIIVEGSTNFLDWTGIETNVLNTVPLFFSDPGTTNFPSRFYRARLQ